ncbi:hypothetical protein NDU88_000119 [Pleurodeles waltl]|uniref:Uncharacterized protein n=1 Tax=Pleurodeles waltl TaxID=8319 RepID=A0AAV7VSJ3_PLEWA|nr:hypothetical protein NDU88_000119 [Pleurodeles waltl]
MGGRGRLPDHGGPRLSARCRLLLRRPWRLGRLPQRARGVASAPPGRSDHGRHVSSWADRAATGARSTPPAAKPLDSICRGSAGTTSAAPPG